VLKYILGWGYRSKGCCFLRGGRGVVTLLVQKWKTEKEMIDQNDRQRWSSGRVVPRCAVTAVGGVGITRGRLAGSRKQY